MTFPIGRSAAGKLAAWYGRGGVFRDWGSLHDTEVHPAPIPGWKTLVVRNWEQLASLQPPGSDSCHFLVRDAGEHSLVLAESRDWVAPFLSALGPAWIPRSPAVVVPRLVRDLIEKPDLYTLGAIYAKVFAWGGSLKTVLLFGDDLANAPLVNSILNRLYPYRANLRRVAIDQEVLTIGSRGEVTLTYRGENSLTEADEALRYISERDYIDWSRRYPLDRGSTRLAERYLEEGEL